MTALVRVGRAMFRARVSLYDLACGAAAIEGYYAYGPKYGPIAAVTVAAIGGIISGLCSRSLR